VFVSEFVGDQRVFRLVEGDTNIPAGTSGPRAESYCQRIVDGRLPKAIPDAMALPQARAIPGTVDLGIGGYLSVPILLGNGRVFGTLCCFSYSPRPGLGDEDVAALQHLADLIAAGIDRNGEFRDELWLSAPGS